MSKENKTAFVNVGLKNDKVTFKSQEFDKHNHLHMMPDEDGPDLIVFIADTGLKISAITFDPDDGCLVPNKQMPAAIVGVNDTNDGAELEKYSVCVTVVDGDGNSHTSDPKIVNDPGN